MNDLDHADCPPGSHDFVFSPEDYGPDAAIQNHDGALRLCNGCKAVAFWCRQDEDYHHAGVSTPSCFLVQEPGQDVPVPEKLSRVTIDPADGKKCCGDRSPIAGKIAFADPEGLLWCGTCALHMALCIDPDCDHPQMILPEAAC